MATLIGVFGDIDLAEDAVQEAFGVALLKWPSDGLPPNPRGWITTTARKRAIDRLRRESRERELLGEVAALSSSNAYPGVPEEVGAVQDDRLRLIFTCCHPALSTEAQVALTLRLLGGLTAGLVLRDVGCDVRVFERSSAALEARGAGIAVLDDTVRYLVQRRVLDVDQVCSTTGWVRYLHPNGSTRYKEKRRYRFSSWTTIYRALLSCFPLDRYHLGREIVGFDQGHGAVVVRFADRTTYTCDLLVCADGIDSSARQLLLPGVVPC